MTPEDLYLHAVINRHRASDDHDPSHRLRSQLAPVLRLWSYGKYLESIQLAGSHAKNTALHDSDVDLFLSLSPDTPGPIADIHRSLAEHFLHYVPQTRNVSVRITFEGFTIDLVPGRRRPNSTHHTLWQSRYDTWLQTDISEQIRYVRSSGLLNEILALKIWRRRNALRFPSFAMELAVIHSLKPDCPISEQFISLLRFLATDFPTTRLLDLANSNNVVSNLLSQVEKLRTASTAENSLRAASWPEIL